MKRDKIGKRKYRMKKLFILILYSYKNKFFFSASFQVLSVFSVFTEMRRLNPGRDSKGMFFNDSITFL